MTRTEGRRHSSHATRPTTGLGPARDASAAKLPPIRFGIIGAQRSRSTYIHRVLRTHPDIFCPKDEFLYFEDPEYGARQQKYLDKTFSRARPGQILGFKRPELLGRQECPPRLKKELSDLRLIVLLREPAWRTFSAYYHYMLFNYLPLLPIERGLRDLLGGRQPSGYPHAHEVLSFSMYGRSLRRYFDLFAREQILVLFDDELDRDPPSVFRRISAHIGLRSIPHEWPERFPLALDPARPNRGIHSLRRLKMLRMATKHIVVRDDASGLMKPQLDLHRRLLFRAALQADSVIVRRVLKDRPDPFDDSLLQSLRLHFSDDVRQLEDLLGRPLPGWSAGA